ncbi:MAG: hypothetical protein ACPLSJ_00830 [Thermosulfidibacteraceae bacterium]|jgi:Tfp pilus assembly protein PilO
MRELSKEALVGTILALLVLVGGYFNFIEPKVNRLADVNRKIKETDRKIEEAKRIEKIIETKKAELANVESEYRLLEGKIPKVTMWDEVLGELAQVTKMSGLKLVSVRFEGENVVNLSGNQTEGEKGSGKLDLGESREKKNISSEERIFVRRVNLELAGKYRSFDTFINSLKNSKMLFTPYKVVVNSDKVSRNPDLKMSLTLGIFRYDISDNKTKEGKKKR